MIILFHNDILGQTVAKMRKGKGISRKKLSQHTGISVYDLADMEKGLLRQIEFEKLCRLCAALGIPPEDLTDPGGMI